MYLNKFFIVDVLLHPLLQSLGLGAKCCISAADTIYLAKKIAKQIKMELGGLGVDQLVLFQSIFYFLNIRQWLKADQY